MTTSSPPPSSMPARLPLPASLQRDGEEARRAVNDNPSCPSARQRLEFVEAASAIFRSQWEVLRRLARE